MPKFRGLILLTNVIAISTAGGVVVFTNEEFRKWHAGKQKREYRSPLEATSPPVAECIVCHRPFGISEGTITDEVAICDICNAD